MCVCIHNVKAFQSWQTLDVSSSRVLCGQQNKFWICVMGLTSKARKSPTLTKKIRQCLDFQCKMFIMKLKWTLANIPNCLMCTCVHRESVLRQNYINVIYLVDSHSMHIFLSQSFCCDLWLMANWMNTSLWFIPFSPITINFETQFFRKHSTTYIKLLKSQRHIWHINLTTNYPNAIIS